MMDELSKEKIKGLQMKVSPYYFRYISLATELEVLSVAISCMFCDALNLLR